MLVINCAESYRVYGNFNIPKYLQQEHGVHNIMRLDTGIRFL